MVSRKLDLLTLNKPPAASGGLGWTLDRLLDVWAALLLDHKQMGRCWGALAGGRLPLNPAGGPNACQPRIPSQRPRDPRPNGRRQGLNGVRGFTNPKTGLPGDV